MRRIVEATLVAGLLASCPARASVLDDTMELVSSGLDFLLPEDFELANIHARLGGAIAVAPDYMGSDRYQLRALPLIDLNYRDRVRLTGTQLKVSLWKSKHWRAGVLGRYRSGRSETTSPDLTGLGKVGTALELGGFGEWRRGTMVLRAGFGQDIASGHGGLVGYVAAEHGLWHSQNHRFQVAAGTAIGWASADYMRSFFGISATQSQASGLAEFRPSAGLRDVSVQLVSRYQLTERWSIDSMIRLGQLVDGAAQSPLVRERGSASQFLSGIGARYSF